MSKTTKVFDLQPGDNPWTGGTPTQNRLANFREGLVPVSAADFEKASAFALDLRKWGRISDDMVIEAYLTGLKEGRKVQE